MLGLKVAPLLAILFVLGAARERQDNFLELKCRDVLQREEAVCQDFCGQNPTACYNLTRVFPLNIRNKAESDPVIDIHVTTFNVGASDPTKENLQDWVFTGSSNQPDLIVIGLQEMVELKADKVVTGSEKDQEKWLAGLKKVIPSNYEKVEHMGLVGIFLVVYKRNDIEFSISDVGKDKVGTGYKIMQLGNKGGVGITMKLNNFKLCIINSHLAAHEGEVEQRNKDFISIRDKLKFTFGAKHPVDHDAIIWMGDTNSRLNTNMEYGAVIDKIDNNHFLEFLEHDQLKQQQSQNKIFIGFHEPTIKFKPTYKFTPGTNTYDRKKQRKPAWCDRILHWRKNPAVGIDQAYYISRHHVTLSDHKPVQSLVHVNLSV